MANPYVKQTWTDGSGGGTPVSAARLNVVEQGVYDAHFKARAVCDTAAAQSFTNNTLTIVRYDTEIEDPDNKVTTGASWQYQAPLAGLYAVNATLMWTATTAWAGTTAETTELHLYKNGAIYRVLYWQQPPSTAGGAAFVFMGGSTLVRLAVNDTIDVRAIQRTGGALAMHNDAANNHIGIVMVSG